MSVYESVSARFVPFVELPRRRLFGFALECTSTTERRLSCAVDIATRYDAAHRPTLLIDATIDDLSEAAADELVARLTGAGLRAETIIVRVPHYASGLEVPGLERLVEAGVLIAVHELDVRGADLGILAGAPIDIVELPAATVAGVDRDEPAAHHARALIELCHRHDWLAFATEVERPGQLALLERLGCDLIGGPVAGRRLAMSELDVAVARYLRPTAPP